MLAARQPGESSLTYIADCCVETYYDRQLGIRDGGVLDLSTRRHSPAQVRGRVDSLQDAPSVWLVMPSNLPETWEAAWALAEDRGIGYRDGVELMRFYRFDRERGDALQFRFGGLLRYEGGVVSPRRASVGKSICVDVTLTALARVDGAYSAGVHVVDGSNALVAQSDGGIGVLAPGDWVRVSRCLELPAHVEPGDYYLHLVVYDWTTLERLPVVEGGTGGVEWGDALVFSAVTVVE
jgi:hypothetical protein